MQYFFCLPWLVAFDINFILKENKTIFSRKVFALTDSFACCFAILRFLLFCLAEVCEFFHTVEFMDDLKSNWREGAELLDWRSDIGHRKIVRCDCGHHFEVWMADSSEGKHSGGVPDLCQLAAIGWSYWSVRRGTLGMCLGTAFIHKSSCSVTEWYWGTPRINRPPISVQQDQTGEWFQWKQDDFFCFRVPLRKFQPQNVFFARRKTESSNLKIIQT